MRPQLPSVFSDNPLDKIKGGVLYCNGYSMHEVSKKENKIKQMSKLATGCTASYGSGKRCQKSTELS